MIAAGIVLATGIVHVLPDSQTALANPCLDFYSDYPWSFTLAGECLMPPGKCSQKSAVWLNLPLVYSDPITAPCTRQTPGSMTLVLLGNESRSSFPHLHL